MQKSFMNGTETVRIEFFEVPTKANAPQDSATKSVLLPIPMHTGDVAFAAMVKGLTEFYFKPMHELTGQNIELDTQMLKSTEEILASFIQDLKRYSPIAQQPQVTI